MYTGLIKPGKTIRLRHKHWRNQLKRQNNEVRICKKADKRDSHVSHCCKLSKVEALRHLSKVQSNLDLSWIKLTWIKTLAQGQLSLAMRHT